MSSSSTCLAVCSHPMTDRLMYTFKRSAVQAGGA